MEAFSAGYVYGVLCSGGKFVWDEKHSNYAVSLETGNMQFADLFMERLSAIAGKLPRKGTHTRKRGSGVVHMNTVTLYGRKEIEELSAAWGLRMGKDWNVPRLAFDDAGFRRGFIQGFCDGNGSVSVNVDSGSKKRYLMLYSMNRTGLANLGMLMGQEGIKASLYPAGDCFVLRIVGKTRLETFRDRIGFGTDVKKKKLDAALLPLSAETGEENP
jgi:hypothetical protein